MKKLIGGLAVCAALMAAVPAAADAFVPVKADRLDAKRFARDFWAQRGERPRCYNVGIRWRPIAAIAQVPMDWRDGDSTCVIVMNSRVDWRYNRNVGRIDPWWRLCQTVIHEYGHLYGMPFSFRNSPHTHGHSNSPQSIMASSEEEQSRSWWWPYHPGCRYDGDGLD